MPGKRYIFGDTIYQLILKMIENEVAGFSLGGRLNLGGDSGEDGGTGGWPRPPVGLLPQKYVAYDTTEAETPEEYGTTRSGWWNSLLDNLNHIRYGLQPSRWFEPRFNDTYYVEVAPGIWWIGASNYIDFQGESIKVTAPDLQPRIDVIYLDTDGNLGISKGVASGTPIATYPESTHLPVCELWIKPSGYSGITVFGLGYFGYASRQQQPCRYRPGKKQSPFGNFIDP